MPRTASLWRFSAALFLTAVVYVLVQNVGWRLTPIVLVPATPAACSWIAAQEAVVCSDRTYSLGHGPLHTVAKADKLRSASGTRFRATVSSQRCVNTDNTGPLCQGQTLACRLENVCFAHEGSNQPGHFYYFGPAPCPQPFIFRNGLQLTMVAVPGKSIETWRAETGHNGSDVVWDHNTTLLWAVPSRQHVGEYYQLLAEQLGALFLMTWDIEPGPDGPAELSLLLANTQPAAPALMQAFAGFRQVTLTRQLPAGCTCFARLWVGTGCRAVWWYPDQWPFRVPVYADFLGLDNAVWAAAQNSQQAPAAHTPQHLSPARFFLRTFLLQQFQPWSASGGAVEPAAAVKDRGLSAHILSSGPPVSVFLATPPRVGLLWPLRIVLASRQGAFKRRLLNEMLLAEVILARFPPAVIARLTILRVWAGVQSSQVVLPQPRDERLHLVDAQPETLLRDQAAVCADANTIIGLHGAGLTNMVYLAPNGRSIVLELTGPHNHVTQIFQVMAHMLGHHYALFRSPGVLEFACRARISTLCKNHDVVVDTAAVVEWLASVLQTIARGSVV